MSETLVSLWTRLRRRLEAAGVDSPVFDARLLVEAGAGVSRLDIVTDPRRALTGAQIEGVEALARRREAREPMAHILGRRQFWTMEFAVNADALIPRPETELLVECALEALAGDRPTRVLDLGVGSGAVLLAVLKERPLATGIGVDSSTAALTLARANAEGLGLASRVELRQGDWALGLEGGFDAVLSNPPYVRSADIAALAPEVARYEPLAALDGGADGLAAYRAILRNLPSCLAAKGFFAFEVGEGQAEAVAAYCRAAGLTVEAIRKDLAGVERVVAGRRR